MLTKKTRPQTSKRRREEGAGPVRWGRLVALGGAGFVWGLGLARFIAEAGLWPSLYGAIAPVVGVAALCALLLTGLALWVARPWFVSTPLSFSIPLFFPALYVVGVFSGPDLVAGGVLLAGGLALALLAAADANPRVEKRIHWVTTTCLAVTVLALYLDTLLPGLGTLDTFEFQVVVPRVGVAHPTGYPLYVLLGKLFTLLPFGNVAWRVNLASVVFATGAVVVLYLLANRLADSWVGLGHLRWLPGMVAGLALATSFTFWSQAIVAEVYALHNLLVVLILGLLLIPSRGSSLPILSAWTPARRWRAVTFLLGLGLTNHLTTALLVPAAILALLWDRPRLRPIEWVKVSGWGLLGLSVYLFIPLRWPSVNEGAWMTPLDFLAYVTGGQFHGALRLDGWRDPTRWAIVGRLLHQPFGWAGLALAVLGLVGLALRRRRSLALTGVVFLAFGVYGLAYYVPDVSVFLLPAHLTLALWIGVGIALVADFLARRLNLGSLALLAALLPLGLIWKNCAAVDRSHDQGRLAWGRYVLNLPLAPDSAILADIDKFAPLYYLQQIEGLRPDLDLLLFGQESLYYEALYGRLAEGQTVYLARYLPDLDGLPMRSVGPLVEVGVHEMRQSAEAMARFGEQIALVGADLQPDPLGRRLYHLTLQWWAERAVTDDLVVRLRLADESGEGETRWASEGVRPVGGLYPSNAWSPGMAIGDYHVIAPPLWLPAGVYQVEVGLFPRFDLVGLHLDKGERTWFPVGAVTVKPPQEVPALPHRCRCVFSGSEAAGLWLTGYDLAAETPAGTPYVVELSWRRVTAVEGLRFIWVDEWGTATRSALLPLASGVVRSRHAITAPQTIGEYTLHVAVDGESARRQWLAHPTDSCPLAAVTVSPSRQGLANFADLILLLEAQVGLSTVQPGATLPVHLKWRALRAVEEDYTVFVHLVGPDGRLWGQEDAWPVQGSYPTSQWPETALVEDPHAVFLKPNAPSGTYRVHVGWYLLETMQRLTVLDAEDNPIGDTFVVGEFQAVD